MLSLWIPIDVWQRLAEHMKSLSDLQSLRGVCRAAYHAVALLQLNREAQVRNTFHALSFEIPPELATQILMVHAVPPNAESLILFVENENGPGIDLAWLRGSRMRRVSLGLQTVPVSTVSNIRFSPDGKHIAFLVSLAHGELIQQNFDPLHRLRGWESTRQRNGQTYKIAYDPCEDCTVQVVELNSDENEMPCELLVHTFSHVFVPEYGFDMVWRKPKPLALELAFAAMLHSTAGAATYLVRWRSFHLDSASNYVFMACIDGASMELLRDKRHAMLTTDSTRCTSRIEISKDANYIFFDTLSKFGILRFDQVEHADSSRVTRADLPNYPALDRRRSPSSSPVVEKRDKSRRDVSRLRSRRALQELNVGNPANSRSPVRGSDDVSRVSRMSPDGTLLCSVIFAGLSPKAKGTHTRNVEVRSSISGKLLYRRSLVSATRDASRLGSSHLCYEKSGDVTKKTLEFSEDSELLALWDTHVIGSEVVTYNALPIVIQARSGRLVQDFHRLQQMRSYEHLYMAPDGQSIYGSWVQGETIFMDAIDVLSGCVLKTVFVMETDDAMERFSGQSAYLLQSDRLLAISKGRVDALWEMTRGSLGCGWQTSLQQMSDTEDTA